MIWIILILLLAFYFGSKWGLLNIGAGIICGILGFFLGSMTGVAGGGGAMNGSLIFALIFFIIGGLFFNKKSGDSDPEVLDKYTICGCMQFFKPHSGSRQVPLAK